VFPSIRFAINIDRNLRIFRKINHPCIKAPCNQDTEAGSKKNVFISHHKFHSLYTDYAFESEQLFRAYPNNPLYCGRLQSPMPALSAKNVLNVEKTTPPSIFGLPPWPRTPP